MGAWGTGPFENDSVQDWIAEYEEAGPAFVRDAFTEIAEMDNYIEVDICGAAWGAAEAVAHAHGRPHPTEEGMAPIFARHSDGLRRMDLRQPAVAAMERVRSDASEMKELWDDAGSDGAVWMRETAALMDRLKGAPT